MNFSSTTSHFKDSAYSVFSRIYNFTPQAKAELKAKLDELNEQLKELKKQYAVNHDKWSDAESYAMLLKCVSENQDTSLEQVSAKLQEAKVDFSCPDSRRFGMQI